MNISPKQIASLITEDPDEYAGLEDADRFGDYKSEAFALAQDLNYNHASPKEVLSKGGWLKDGFWYEARPQETYGGNPVGKYTTATLDVLSPDGEVMAAVQWYGNSPRCGWGWYER